ncbi:unnamed protein product [Adineta ricciae]|uniref:Prolyl 4-hydroxylase alpha subunit Fe(2+) 2OG dioxygenase domain-containing protein n=1 Tax=Adineta ricciae TaxID=249248 RepID=A0A816DYN1_ADIRI|nr:unnamed protein product [Adineta ricciae]CAF1639940.1 unnamed protein product [Adineta ricciae]
MNNEVSMEDKTTSNWVDVKEQMSGKALEMFGSWINNIEKLNEEFANACPFPNVVLQQFFVPEMAEKLYQSFPKVTAEHKWILYNNPIERKYALTDFTNLPQFNNLFLALQSSEFVSIIKKISGIENLESDPHLHGAGLHQHAPGGKLDMHLDYSIHPITGKERRVNLIIYLTKDWLDEYEGAIELWNSEFTRCEKKIYPSFNNAVLFRTSDVSYHGLPFPIKCPQDNSRKSIAIYYVSDPRSNTDSVRYKAQFRPLPTQPVNDNLKKLYLVREKRIITKEDLETIYPNWESDGNGYW